MIRPAQIDDCRSVFALVHGADDDAAALEAFERDFTVRLRDGHYLTLVADDGGELSGYVCVHMTHRPGVPVRLAEVVELAVARDGHNTPVGAYLMAEAARAARAAGCPRIQLATQPVMGA